MSAVISKASESPAVLLAHIIISKFSQIIYTPSCVWVNVSAYTLPLVVVLYYYIEIYHRR